MAISGTVNNPKTTLAGYGAILGALVGLFGAIEAICTGQAWCHYVSAAGWGLGVLLNGMGNIAAKDGGH